MQSAITFMHNSALNTRRSIHKRRNWTDKSLFYMFGKKSYDGTCGGVGSRWLAWLRHLPLHLECLGLVSSSGPACSFSPVQTGKEQCVLEEWGSYTHLEMEVLLLTSVTDSTQTLIIVCGVNPWVIALPSLSLFQPYFRKKQLFQYFWRNKIKTCLF